jgi:hypothetical protein
MPGPSRPERRYKFDHPLSDEQLIAIGKITVEGATLEHALEWAIWKVLRLGFDVGELFTKHQTFEAKVKTFTRVAHKVFHDDKLRKQAANIAACLRNSSARRNAVVHASWVYITESEFGPSRAVASTRKLGEKAADTHILIADEPTLLQIAADLSSDWFALIGFLEEAGLDPYRLGDADDHDGTAEP